MPKKSGMPLLIGSAALLALVANSGINPYDRLTWLMEVFPVLIALPVLWFTRGRFPLTNFTTGSATSSRVSCRRLRHARF